MQGKISKLLYKSATGLNPETRPPARTPHAVAPFMLDKEVALRNKLKTDALRSVGHYLLAGLGIGAGARGLLGLTQLTSSNLAKKNNVGLSTTVAEMPVPRLVNEEDEEDDEAPRSQKFASGLYEERRPPEPPKFLTGQQHAISPAWATWNDWKPKPRGMFGHLAGDDATTKPGIPWYIPAIGIGAAGTAYGGYKLVDWLLNKRRKSQTDEELTESKQRYRNALFAQYTPEQVEKWSSVTLGQGLDLLFDVVNKHTNGQLEKLAIDIADTSGKAFGLLGLMGGSIALGTGIGTYKYVKSRSPEERIKKVIQQRERERWLRRPPEIFAIPTTVPVTHPKFPENQINETEDEEETRQKVAALVNELFS